ncbi:GNAT family N-acetyltransferase [Paraeggerthella sp.]|uniref:GNAT family N-acetyltransferase n=1 Tax=Paraeggerthella sp. TaxID=2897350 RepID=UPI001C68F9D0
MSERDYLRPATMDDAELILRWVNDPLDRANSFSSEEITLEEHLRWLSESLEDPARYLYIMVHDGSDVGHVKLYVSDEEAEIGYCVAPEWRGNGFANQIVKLIVDEAKENIPGVKRLCGQVRTGNQASLKVFRKLGFAEESITFAMSLND